METTTMTISGGNLIINKMPYDFAYYNSFNCFGYAVNVLKWLCIDPTAMKSDEFFFKIISKELAKYNFKHVEKIVENKICVVCRRSRDDFHFMKKDENNVWSNKLGEMPIEFIDESDVFTKIWDTGDRFKYNGQIFIFVKE